MESSSVSVVAEWISRYGLLAVFVAPMLEIVLPIVPGDVTLVFVGYAARGGYLPLVPVMALGGAGAMAGITASYAIGRFLGAPFVEKFGRYMHVSPRSLDRVNAWYQRYGKFSLTFGFFIPGARHVIAIAAGIGRLGFLPFAVFAYMGALLWASALVLVGYYFGHPVFAFVVRHHDLLLLIAGVVTAALVVAWVFRRRLAHRVRARAASHR